VTNRLINSLDFAEPPVQDSDIITPWDNPKYNQKRPKGGKGST